MRPKKKGLSKLKIAAHLTNYVFITDKVHKNPYIAHYCFIRVTALLEYLYLGILKIFGGGSRAPFDPPVSAPGHYYTQGLFVLRV